MFVCLCVHWPVLGYAGSACDVFIQWDRVNKKASFQLRKTIPRHEVRQLDGRQSDAMWNALRECFLLQIVADIALRIDVCDLWLQWKHHRFKSCSFLVLLFVKATPLATQPLLLFFTANLLCCCFLLLVFRVVKLDHWLQITVKCTWKRGEEQRKHLVCSVQMLLLVLTKQFSVY